MAKQSVHLCVPALPSFARTVRMAAANLAVVCNMNVDEVEDVRMAVEEGFVLCCATGPACCDVSFTLDEGEVHASFALGPTDALDTDESELAELLLAAVCDEYGIADDGSVLYLVKRAEMTHGDE